VSDPRGRHLPAREIARLCYGVGWTDADRLVIAVAVCIAESNGYEKRRHENLDAATGDVLSVDRGIWMINDRAHPTIYDAIAYDALRATQAARQIYLAWRSSFGAWAAYTNGRWEGEKALGYAAEGVQSFLLEKHVGYPPPWKV
jgi:hypothetical protein